VSVLRAALAEQVGKERFALWFGSGTRLELNDDTLTIGAPNRFFKEWLHANFRGAIETACRDTLGKCPTLFFVDCSLPEAGGEASKSVVPPPHAKPSAAEPAVPAVVGETPAATAPEPPKRKFLGIETFVSGPGNRLARAAAEMVIERPGSISPLVLHGPTGVGKTHLLQSIWTGVRRGRPAATAIYLSAEQFTTTFLQALRGSGLPSFRQKYRGTELLLIDDLQFFCGKRYTQMELLYTVDALLREGKQVVFAADRPSSELTELGPELCARLQGGMTCRLEPPDYETRRGILDQMARRMEIQLPEDVRHYVASRLTSHARELSGALCRLDATRRAFDRPIDLALAEETLGELVRASNRVVRLPDIERAICDAFGLAPQSLQSAAKAKRVSHPRMLAMWLARKYTRAALSEICQYFGRKSHSTVVSAQKRVDGWLSEGTALEMADSAWKIDDAIRKVEQRLLAG
jgi:chromosomal replication initiator protein